jgi:formate--tetrahydrofolate ligase
MHGGGDKKNLGVENLGALEKGLPNLEKHIENVRHFGVPGVVALNRRMSDSDAELDLVSDFVSRLGVPIALTEVWEKGGAGGEALGAELLSVMDKKGAEFRPLYPTNLPIKEKIDIIVRQIYGGDGADYSPSADRAIEYLESIGWAGRRSAWQRRNTR